MDLKSPISAVIRAGLSTAPFTGGIASLWADWDSHRRFARVEEALKQLAQAFSEERDFISGQLGDAEMHLLEDALSRIASEHRDEKRRQFVSVLASSWKRPEVSFDDRQLFLKALDEFSDVHITVLREIKRISGLSGKPVPASQLYESVCGIDDPEKMWSTFVPALNSLAATFGFVRREGERSGKIMMNVNLDGLAMHVHCSLMSKGEEFLRFLDAT